MEAQLVRVEYSLYGGYCESPSCMKNSEWVLFFKNSSIGVLHLCTNHKDQTVQAYAKQEGNNAA